MDNPIRMTVKVFSDKDPELAAELGPLGPYKNAKRLLVLARIGLLVSQGRIPIADGLGEIQKPAAAADTAAAVPLAASSAIPVLEQEPYRPDISTVFDFGVSA